jgi:hypothetical protein
MKLATTVNKVRVEIDLPGVTEAAYNKVGKILKRALAGSGKNRDAILEAFLHALRMCPTANASDVWHHVVYRQYCEILVRAKGGDPKQSWVRAGGEALELTVEKWYTPVLEPHGIRIQALIGGRVKMQALQEMGIAKVVGAGKLDVVLRRRRGNGWDIFGGVHVKASLAERVSDDVPASRAMMGKALLSPLWTLDVKSFPPPHGDLVNRGELGTPKQPSEKRRYIEEHGDFDNCYSANERSAPSDATTPSGKRVYRINLSKQPDQFARDLIARARARS